MARKRLGEILIQAGLLDEARLRAALREQSGANAEQAKNDQQGLPHTSNKACYPETKLQGKAKPRSIGGAFDRSTECEVECWHFRRAGPRLP